jgi:hypothetical protein
VQTTAATIRAKRTQVSGSSGRYGGGTHTIYFATFEFTDGTRREARVPADVYGRSPKAMSER